jgi:hypothetical protein
VLESEADRLAMIQAVGEAFTTSRAEKLWLVFDREFIEQTVGQFTTMGHKPMGVGRTSDVALHEIVKQSVITRDSDGSKFTVRDFHPDGTGMTVLVYGA